MNYKIAGYCVVVLLLAICRPVPGQGREEFNGPFNSWANVKTRFGAKGNGKDDDTKALQRAIDSLSCQLTGYNMGKTAYMVVYLPAGTYCISSTLVLKGKIGVNIIGEDPSRTVIKWTGGNKDTLLWADGAAYYKISRLTWDANGRKEMEGLGIHWKDVWNDGRTRSFASLNIEVSDCYFTGGFKYGISGGSFAGVDGSGHNDSEIAIKRCVFRNCDTAGLEIHGFNALDYWVWDCSFLNCGRGIWCANGGYHVYRSFFSGSRICDVHNRGGYYTSLRGCYSEKSRALSEDDGMSSNPFKRIFQDNTVIDPHLLPIEYYHLGKITLWGNMFTRSIDTTRKFIVTTRSWAPGIYEVMSLHNTYPYKEPIQIGSTPNKIYSFGDRMAPVQPAAPAFQAGMDKTPPTVLRKVLEVPPGATADAIQAIIDQAAGMKGKRPVVHFGMGVYYIDKPLVIPPGSDLQLEGDGLVYASAILKKKTGLFRENAMIIVKGPSYINIQDLQIGSDDELYQEARIVFENVDQPGAQAHIDQVYAHTDTALVVEKMNYLYVQKDNSFFMDGNFVSGGDAMQKGKGTARVCCFGGQFVRLHVEGNGRFLAKDCWWEGSTSLPLDLQGSGEISLDGALISPARYDSATTIRVGKFNGTISLMNMYVVGALSVQPDNPGLSVLAWNLHFYHKMDPLAFLKAGANYQGAFLGFNAQCFRSNDPACKSIISINDEWRNVRDTGSFLDKQTAFDRDSRPVLFRDVAAQTSNIRISRVSLLGSRGAGFIFTDK